MGTVTLSPIERGVAPGGLLRSAGAIPTSPSPWGGVTFTTDCGAADSWACDTVGEKTFTELGNPVLFDSYLIYSAHECGGRHVEDVLRSLSRANLNRNASQVVARELQLATRVPSNPSLNSEAYDITATDLAGAASTVCAGASALLSAAGDCGNVDMIIHAPRVALPALLTSQLATFNFDTGQYFIGAHRLVVDDFSQQGPSAVATANQAWLYATGPVEVALGDTMELSHYRRVENASQVVVERPAVHRFDPCCVYAILIDLC